MSGEAAPEYIHGTDPEEQARLSLLNDLLNLGSLRELSLRGGERILDVGSGLGQLSRAMARATGVRVVGVERSAEQIAEAQRQAARAGETGLVELRQGDALQLPLRDEEWGTFDVAHTRFLLEHVADPLAVVRAMARARCDPADASCWKTTITTGFDSGWSPGAISSDGSSVRSRAARTPSTSK